MNKLYNHYKLITSKFYKIPQPEKWVFLGGTTNAGTTLLANILSSSKDIGSLPTEGQFCTNQFITARELGIPRLWTEKIDLFRLDESFENISVNELKRNWASFYDKPNSAILVEKSPVNSSRMKWLQKNFENSHFICLVRNGYAVSEGIVRKTGCSIERAAKQWALANRVMIEDLPFIKNKIIIMYEDLVDNTETTIKKIENFISSNLNFDKNKERIIHSKRSQIKNMNNRSLNNLSQKEISIINNFASDVLDHWGYKIR